MRIPILSEDPTYSRLFIAFFSFFLVNAVWTIFSTLGLDLSRVTRVFRMQVGETFPENFEVVNRSIIPKVWLKITDRSEFAESHGSKVLTWIGGKQVRAYVAYSVLEKRGWFSLGQTWIETGDIFGLFLYRKTINPQSRLLVIPYTVHLREFPAPYGLLPGGRALRQKTLEVTPYAAGVREFVPGDPLKRIHWPTSARKQKLIVKEFEKDPMAEVWIFLDARESVHFNQQIEQHETQDVTLMKQKSSFILPPSTEEYAVSTAASIARYYIRQKREVGLISAGQNYAFLPAERGDRQLGKILETLAVLRAKGDLPVWGLLSSQLVHLTRGSTIILITPSTDQKIFSVVLELIQRGVIPVVILIDQISFGGRDEIDDLESKLVNRGILTFVVKNGDSLQTALENTKTNLEKFAAYH
jgi:uncharacterized protein (DUF58 family)